VPTFPEVEHLVEQSLATVGRPLTQYPNARPETMTAANAEAIATLPFRETPALR